MKRYSILFRLFGIILFIYILSRIDISELTSVLKKINLAYYLIGVSSLFFWVLIRTLKWKRLINSIGVKAPVNVLLRIMAKGIFLGVVTPAKLGEFWRAKYLAESTAISRGSAFYTAFMDRLMDLLVIGLVTISGLLVIYLKFSIGVGWQLYVLGFVLFIFLSFVFLKKIGLQRFFKIFAGFLIPASWKEQVDAFLAEFDDCFRAFKPRLFLEMLAYSFFHYLVATTAYYFIALALGIFLPFWYLFLIVAMVWLILTLPLTFFGLGTREAGFIYFFSILGISSSLTVAFSLLVLFANILLSIPGVILFLKQK